MEDELRGFVRIPERLITLVKDPTTGKVHRALTNNLSGTGLCLAAEETFNSGASLELELQMPDRKITFTGEVMWSRPIKGAKRQGLSASMREIGVKYVKIDPKDLSFIKQHIAMNAAPGF